MLENSQVFHLTSKTKTTSMNGIPWQNDHNTLRGIQRMLTRLDIYFHLLSLGIKCYFCISPEFLPTLSVHTTIIHPSEWMVGCMHTCDGIFPLDTFGSKFICVFWGSLSDVS